MNLYDNTLSLIKDRKYRAETGQLNCIPFAIPHLRNIFPGLEKSNYLLLTGASKAGKTQISNFLILYNAIFYAFYHRDQLRVKFIYFPLEESKEIVTLRFISFLLYTKYKIRLSPLDLLSSNTDKPVPNEAVALIEGEYIQSMVQFFNECVEFHDDVGTSVGINIVIDDYAEAHGTIVYSDETFIDDETGEERHYIDHYEPNDPDEYVHILIDNYNLLAPTKKEGNILNAITNASKSMVKVKNKYKYIIVALQQQLDSESNSLEAIKNNNILASKAGLKDCKSTANDCTLLWGITNIGALQIVNDWHDYSMGKFKRKYFRVFQLIMNRFGEGDITVPLYFDGAVNYYKPLPPALIKQGNTMMENPALQEFYTEIERIEQSRIVTTPQQTMFFINTY